MGYTGDNHDNPTVHFYFGGASQTVGHITQAHDIPENVGRERVRTDPGYYFDNVELKNGKMFFYETWHKQKNGKNEYRIPAETR